MTKKIYLVLQNGEVFEGKSFGSVGDTIGELVFSTNMNGFVETLTDPNYFGQIVIQTFPLVGGYGFIEEDANGQKPQLKGYIVREHCDEPSNFRCDKTIDKYLEENGIIGLCDIDTRELTTRIREVGVMNAKITDNIDNLSEILREIRMYSIDNAVEKTTCSAITSAGEGYKVALYDFGNVAQIASELLAKGCEVIRVPSNTSAKDILATAPQGIILTDGAGDPHDNRMVINEIAQLIDSKLPIFGIGLGHEILALAMGAHIRKLKFGHRGSNQPVKRVENGTIYITAQNHGYSVISKSLPKMARVSFTNVNDGACEGIEYDEYPMFSTQFHPTSGSTLQDTTYLYDKFIKLMEENTNAKK